MSGSSTGKHSAAGSSPTRGVVRWLLWCGVGSSVLYIATDILAATQLYPGYSYTAQQVSELSALGAPTRGLWIAMSILWAVLVIAFAFGVWLSSQGKVTLRLTAILVAAYGLIGLAWVLFAPMHARGTVALETDASHIIFAAVQVLNMVLFIALGSGAAGRGFRVYSIATIVLMLGAGAIPGTQTQAMAAGQPTPWLGAIERVSVYLPVLWVGVFGLVLLAAPVVASSAAAPTREPERLEPVS